MTENANLWQIYLEKTTVGYISKQGIIAIGENR